MGDSEDKTEKGMGLADEIVGNLTNDEKLKAEGQAKQEIIKKKQEGKKD